MKKAIAETGRTGKESTPQDGLIAGAGVDSGNNRYHFETTGQNYSLTRKT
ncbi:hypothetical protein LJR235_002654 [Pararhizobium sp. LjRoot235]